MRLAEAWRLSRIPYREVVYRSLAEEKGRMWWGAFGRNQPSKEGHNDHELTKRALRIAKFDKIIVSVFNVFVCLAPFAVPFLGATNFGVASSIALSLAVSFGLTTLYAIQTLSSFVSAESTILLSTLPIERNDFSLITLFSFVRSVDYIVFGSMLSQAAAVFLVTGMPAAALIMFFAAVMNELFAVTIALWFSRVFQKNLLRGGKSRGGTALRLAFIFMWGALLISVGFLFSIPWYIVPNLENIILGLGQISSLLLSLLYPFSTGILVASISYSNVALVAVVFSSIAMAGYALLAVLAGRWSLGTAKNISQGAGMKIARIAVKDFSVRIHAPLMGYVLKDLKVASRNPATAFFFALPVLETVIIALMISSLETLRATAVLVATTMGGIFALFIPLALLTAEGRGLEYTKTLPISTRRIIVSKTLVSTASYVLVPLALLLLSSAKPLTTPYTILIPFLMAVSVASASIFEIKLFLRDTTTGKIDAIVNDIGKLVVGVLTVIVPEVAYAAAFLLAFSHSLSVLVMGTVTFAELAVAVYLLNRS